MKFMLFVNFAEFAPNHLANVFFFLMLFYFADFLGLQLGGLGRKECLAPKWRLLL